MSRHKRFWNLGVALLLPVALLAAWALFLGIKVSEATAQPLAPLQRAAVGATKPVPFTATYCTPPLCLEWSSIESDATRSVAWGDVDGDGDLDLAVGNDGQNRLYRNEGGGPPTFTLIWSSIESDQTSSVAWGDVDGDGDLDLAVGNQPVWGSGQFVGGQNRLYRNNGGGTFTLVWSSTETDRTTSVAWGDVDGDGDLDLAVGNHGQNRLYRNDGGALPTLTLVWSSNESDNTQSVAWGDVDGDGDLDLAVGNYSGQHNRLYRNDGGTPLTLTRVWSFTESDWTTSLAWGDVDGDGDLDLAVGNFEERNHLYRNDGGTPLTFTRVWTSTESDYTISVAWGDYNGDGDLDLAVGNNNTPNRLYLNEDDTLTSYAVWSSAELKTQSVAWGDVDGDGDLDLAVGNFGPNLLYRNDNATLTPSADWYSAESDWTLSAAWGDVDGDGALDLAVGNDGQNRLYRNDGGTPLTLTRVWSSAESDRTYSVAWGDVDGDGDLDLAVGNSFAPNRLYLNESGTLTSYAVWSSIESDATRSVAWGDVDGDGDLDLAVGNQPVWDGGQYVGGQNRLYRNNGGGTFALVWSSAESDRTGSVAWGDVDGDGDLDLAVGNWGVNRLYRNDNGTLTSTAVWSPTESDDTTSVAWGDVDGDGDLDLAVGNNWGSNQLYRNDNGTLTSNVVWSSIEGYGTRSVAWGDVDGDGDLDLAVGNAAQPNHLYRNDGGTLTSYAVWSSTESDATYSVAWGDVDSDGDLDLAVGNVRVEVDVGLYVGGQNSLYRNGGRGSSGLPNHPPSLAFLPSYGLTAANFYAISGFLTTQSIPIPYTLSDPEGDRVGGLRAYYSLNGGGQWHPAIAASGTLTHNLPTEANALAFDGVDDYVDLPDMNPDYTNGLTIGAWVYYDSFQHWSRIADFGNGPAANNIILANRLTSNDLVLGVYQGSTEHLVIAPQVLETGRWIHIAGTIAADGSVRLYRDGTQVAAGTLPLPNVLTRTQNYIARSNWSGDGYLDGSLHDVRLYNRALSPAEVVTLAHNGEPEAAGLAGHWPLDEGAGTIAHDQVAAHHGTLVNGPSWIRSAVGTTRFFTWDTFASGFFGQSDNVVFRLVAHTQPATLAVTGTYQYPNSVPALQHAYATATTFPFRVRGMQVRVISETTPASNALVYRLLAGQTGGGMPLADQAELPYRTDAQGYLQGRGQLAVGDQLVALLPVSITDTYTLYHTSAAVTATGLDAHTVLTPGVQVLTVTAAQPLILFNLDVSLEWDARQDPLYLAQLEYDLQRASEFLYDWSNGQIALGAVQIYQHREHWDTADVRIYASNRLRPNAIQGGVTASQTPDPDAPAILYTPGQVRMGVTWSRYGETGNYAEDWPRALAHELGHYLLYLDDNYLGFDAGGNLIPVDTCTGAMSDPYRGDWPYDEFHANDAAWAADCAATLSQQRTGRADWATVQRFYPQLHFADNIGPRVLPLAVTQVQWVTPTAGLPLADPLFYLVTPDGARLQPGARARAFLFQGDALVDLGRPGLDRVYARGARVGERLCVVAADAQQVGCTVIGATARQVVVHTYPDWQPDLVITPLSSRTFTVTVGNLLPGLTLHAQLYAHLGAVTAAQPLSYTEGVYQTVLHTTAPAIGGHLHLWDATQPATAPRREALTDYALGGSPGGEGDFGRGGRAPTLSSDGQAILYGPDLAFPEGEFYALQATPVLPHPPAWATVVGQAYRLLASGGAPPLTDASLSFQYLGSEVPAGEETWLKLYYWDGSLWQQLPTQVNTDYNTAVALVQGAGLYALMASLEIPLPMEGWNNFAYPVNATRPVTEALLSITDYYTTVYGYQRGEWLIYDKGIQPVGLNTLGALEFGQGYWISVTQAITLNLRGTNSPGLLGNGSAPVPATYYGEVRAGANFTPTAGQVVQAWVGGQLCGEAETRALAGKIWYLLPVAAGCGGPGQAVQFRVEGRACQPVATWSNRQAHAWPLTPDQAPLADAGPDQNLDTLASVILNGSASSDPDGDYPLVYHWTQTGGPPVAFTPHMSVTTFTAPTDPTVLTFTLTVTDSLGLASLPDTVTITVEGYRIYLPLTLRQ